MGRRKAVMNQVKLTRRGKAVLWIAIALAAFMFGYKTQDVCWVGTDFPGNTLGYGSCQALIDATVGGDQ